MPTAQDNITQLIQKTYDAFNRRDIDATLEQIDPQVQWPNGWEGGWVHGHNEVRDYWTRQWKEVDPHVTPVAIAEQPDSRVQVRVHQVVKDRQGSLIADGFVNHVYTFENGQVVKMEIEPAD